VNSRLRTGWAKAYQPGRLQSSTSGPNHKRQPPQNGASN